MSQTDTCPSNSAPILEGSDQRNIWVVGDLMLDAYIDGSIDRVSPEASVHVLRVNREFDLLGGAANVARAICSLGARVVVGGVIGEDKPGDQLLVACERLDIESAGVVRDGDRGTTRKIRVMSRNNQLIRLDWEHTAPISDRIADSILAGLRSACEPDAIVVSDYAKGVLTSYLLNAVIEEGNSRNVPVLVDPKARDFSRYANATIVTPNLKEFCAAVDREIDPEDDSDLLEAAANVCRQTDIASVLVTMGSRGMVLWTREGGLFRLPTTAQEVSDVTGAGDTVVGALAVGLSQGAPVLEAARLANTAAGIAVSKVGTAAVTTEELSNALCPPCSSKVLDGAALSEQLRWWRLQKKKIVFTNGCFDLLHAGHLKLLSQSAAEGDILIVGLNSDASMNRLGKGRGGAVIPQDERAAMLAAFEWVKAVAIFDEDTPLSLIRQIRPDVLVKGADYQLDDIVGRTDVEASGGRVVRVELLPDRSTTSIIERIRRLDRHDPS